MNTHQPRVVLVSGCSAGFGFRSARALARAGHHVIAGIRSHSVHGQQYGRSKPAAAEVPTRPSGPDDPAAEG